MVSRWDKGPAQGGNWDPGGPPPVSKRTKVIAIALTVVFVVASIIVFCLILGQLVDNLIPIG